MSVEDYLAVASADAITTYEKSSEEPDKNSKRNDGGKKSGKSPSLGRFLSFQSVLRPNIRRVRTSIRKLSCVKKDEDEEMPMLDVPRHKSIDIGVGLARRVSLFLFTRRTICVHPYHPYTPEQTTRKLNLCFDDKIK